MHLTSSLRSSPRDTDLILAQRLGEWVGHGPVLEEDIASTNVGLDLLGQARLWYAYAGEVEARFAGADATRMSSPSCATRGEFRNLLLVEQPNGNYADTMARQFYFDVWHDLLLAELVALDRRTHRRDRCEGAEGSALPRRAQRRLGDPARRRHRREPRRMQAAIDDLWMYTGEMFEAGRSRTGARGGWHRLRRRERWPRLARARARRARRGDARRLRRDAWMQGGAGGKQGVHTEHVGPCSPQMQVAAAQPIRERNGERDAMPDTREPTGATDAADDLDGAAAAIPDPEIPVISIVELGIVRDVAWAATSWW